MNNFNYKRKYHYFVKYLVIALPIIIALLMCFRIPDNSNYNLMLESFSEFLTKLLLLDISSWYTSLLGILSVDVPALMLNPLGLLLISYPLYIFYVYVFDLILDVFVLIPKLFHKFMERVGGYN